MPPEPPWPKRRDLARYNTLVGFDIKDFLRGGGLWIDIGVGRGAKPMRPLIGRPRVRLKAISPYDRSLPPEISLTIGRVPEHAGFLSENRGRTRLVTDIFGAVSYCDDPIQAVIYGALLLGPGGRLVAFTELHRLGDIEAWDRMTKFFNRRLRQQIGFQTVYLRGDAWKGFSTYLRVQVQGRSRSTQTLRTILREARIAIGRHRRGIPLWVSSDRSAKIWKSDYRIGR